MERLRRAISILVLAALAPAAGCDAGRLADRATLQGAPIRSHAAGQNAQVTFVRGYHHGYAQAEKQGKPMLVLFVVPGCSYCEQTVREASTDETVVRLSERFVCILVDADREPEICREFRVRGYPTIQFMSPRGVPLNRLTGRTGADQLALQMQAALQATASRLRRAVESAVR
jgi:thiol-disulfide isomerase/thioredoxin